MTGSNSKVRAVFLSALMVLSVFGGAAAFAGGAAAASNATLSSADEGGVANASSSAVAQTIIVDDTDGSNTEQVAIDNITLSQTGGSLTADDFQQASLVIGGTTVATNDSINSVESIEFDDFSSGGSNSSSNDVGGTTDKELAFSTDGALETIRVELTFTSSAAASGDQYTFQSEVQLLSPPAAGYNETFGGASAYSKTTTSQGSISLDWESGGSNNAVTTDGKTFFQGQEVVFGDFNATEDLTLSRVTDSGTQFVSEYGSNGTGQVLVDTSDLSANRYWINGTESNTDTKFQIAVQSLNAEFDENEVPLDDSVDVDVNSNRNSYDLNVTSDEYDAEELESALSGDFDNTVTYQDNESVLTLTNVPREATLNFTPTSENYEAGAVNFTFKSFDTTAQDSASVTISEEEGVDANVESVSGQSTVQTPRGDISNIVVTLDNTDNGYLVIGGDDANYYANISLEDGNDDGEVQVNFNTYLAGNTTVPDSDIVYPEDDDDTADLETHSNLDQLLGTGGYDLSVNGGNSDAAATLDNPDNRGTLFIQERQTNGITAWTAPSGTLSGAAEEEDLRDALNENDLTQDSSVALGDQQVFAVKATGIFGAYEAYNGNLTALQDQYALTINQTNPGTNLNKKVLNWSASDFSTLADAENNTLYIYAEEEDIKFDRYNMGADKYKNIGMSDGDKFNTSFRVYSADDKDDAMLIPDEEDTELVSTMTSAVEPEVTLDTNENDEIEVASAAGQTVTGTSTLAPGTEVTVTLQSDSQQSPFIVSNSSDLTTNGTFAVTFDMSSYEVGTNFTAKATAADANSDEIDGVIVESTGTTTTNTTTSTTSTTSTTTTSTTSTTSTTTTSTTSTTSTTTSTTSGGTPGFGAGLALVALAGAALLALRRDN